MSIPLDRLYHIIEDIAQRIIKDRVIIYHFYPHGSKNVENMQSLNKEKWQDAQLSPNLYCVDQEPLDYDYYKDGHYGKHTLQSLLDITPHFLKNYNIYEQILLLHSEQRSFNLQQYQQDQFITVYWWSHAVISLDWFRFAQHVTLNRQSKKTFLIYNRAWSGTREYRLRFVELLIQLDLQDSCQTSVNPIEPGLGIHYDLHHFKNSAWRPNTVLEDYFLVSTAKSHDSADFDINDYESTDIEVVLETLFDDDRLHLTEKSLRPIALGHPFILAGTYSSLEYLRSYGFKTFNDVWDESYDTIKDPEERLYAITDLMAQIASWGAPTKKRKMSRARKIAEYNRRHFFSQQFFDIIVCELTDNLKIALAEVTHTKNYQQWLDRWDKNLLDLTILETVANRTDLLKANLPAINHIKELINSKLNPD